MYCLEICNTSPDGLDYHNAFTRPEMVGSLVGVPRQLGGALLVFSVEPKYERILRHQPAFRGRTE